MFQFFILFFLINEVINLTNQKIFLSRLNIKIMLILIFFYFLFTSYYGSKFYIIIHHQYIFNQLTNYLLINLFNVNWTNLYLLYSVVMLYVYFIFSENLFSVNSKILKQTVYKLLTPIFLYFFLKNFSEMYVLPNEKLFFFTNFVLDINSLLLNNLVLIHPILTHILYGFFIIYSFQFFIIEKIILIAYIVNKKYWITWYRINTLSAFYYDFNKKIFLFINITFLTIFLGSVWAAQELVWNSWWNWDIIEIIAFGFFILLTLFIHIFKKSNYFWQVKKFSIESIIIFTLFYFFIRLDISASLHSFNLFDSIEIYLYFIYIYLVLLFSLLLSKKKIIKKTYFNNKLMLKLNKFVYIILFFKCFLLSLYFYCFVIWFNDSEGYVIKNEIVWLYSLIYKFILLEIYFVYYFFIFKINWLIFIFISINFILYIYIYKYIKYTYKYIKNIYILIHILIFLFIGFNIIDNFVQLLSYTSTRSFKLFNVFYLTKKLNLFFWSDITNINEINFFINKILFFKYQYNSFLLFKVNYISVNNFDLTLWNEQSYNYYLNNNYVTNFLKNIYFKENDITIIINKTTHYILMGSVFWYLFYKINSNRKKIKFLNLV